MSSTSHDHGYGFDPNGTDPVATPRGTGWWLDYEQAAGAARLFAESENDFWLGWLLSTGLVGSDWRPAGDSSLVQLWEGVLRANLGGVFRGCSWTEIAANPPVPLWLRLVPSSEDVLGVEGCRVVAAVIAGASKWMETAWGAFWKPVEPCAGEPALAVLAVPGSTGAVPYQQLSSAVRGVTRSVERNLNPNRLLEWVYLFEPGGELASIAGISAEDEGGPSFDLSQHGESRWFLYVDDVTAHEEEDRYERLAVLLAQAVGISDCIHEDRELILFCSELGHDTLMSIIEQLWERTAPEGND